MKREFLQGHLRPWGGPFAYYKEYQAEMSKPLVHSSSQVHTMIREYTNQEVARILEEEEGSQVKLVPAVILNGRDVRLEFKVGREKMYAVRDLAAFSDAVAVGAYVEYGKELAFHHQGSLSVRNAGDFCL